MDKLKQYIAIAVGASLLVLVAGWFLLVSPKRSEAADLRSQATQQVTANSQLEAQLAVLKAQAKDLPKQQAKLAAVAAKIPDNPSLPTLMRSLTAAASAAGIELVSVTPGQPTAVAAAPAAKPVVAAAGAKPAIGPAAAAARAGAAAAASVGQLETIPVALNIVGGYFQVEQFVSNLESLPRAMRVSNITLAPGANPVAKQPSGSTDDGKTLVSTITAQVFMAANRAPASVADVPGQAAAGSATTPVAPVATVKK